MRLELFPNKCCNIIRMRFSMRSLLLLALVLAEAFPCRIRTPCVTRRDDNIKKVAHKFRPRTIKRTTHVDAEGLRPSRNLHDTITKIQIDASELRPSRNLHDTITKIQIDASELHPSRLLHQPCREHHLHVTDASALYDAILEVLRSTDSDGLHDAIAKILDDFMSGRLYRSGSGGRYGLRSGGHYSLYARNRLRPEVRTEIQNGYCGSGWTYFNSTNSCYKTLFDETWTAAESICVLLGGHLTSIHSPEENLFVSNLSKAGVRRSHWKKATWIGLHQASYPSSKEWTWTDGTKVDYSPFARREPNNLARREQCAQLYSDEPHSQQWNDYRCDAKMRNFVCKKKSYPLL
ncbi:unnamed protein product [Cylicocyclus nassatus]|uniref:C-type lectin domain-containing protein n=1 Tax=Cylicocyclus nassatus TaxID=53992 RepID=A0AA36LYZ5_CYLNA|nr:unnamed protein product [Cylicocyclus nassatus]